MWAFEKLMTNFLQSNGDPAYANNEVYKLCLTKKIHPDLAKEICIMLETLGLTTEDFDERAMEQIATFPLDQGKYIVKELKVHLRRGYFIR
jgi:hypothetical protein